MFVFRRKDLPPDPVFPADLEKLGYFINDNDQIRKISDPEAGFQFKINRNDRWNELNREAMNGMLYPLVSNRTALGQSCPPLLAVIRQPKERMLQFGQFFTVLALPDDIVMAQSEHQE
ncbi:hypothetical protein VTN02DRAFT_6012 [Thermoascus thermophilus]